MLKKLFIYVIVGLFLFSLKTFASVAVDNVKDNFRLPENIRENTDTIPQDVAVFFTDLTYSIPPTARSCNILETNKVTDPLEGYNRSMFDVNSLVLGKIIRPLARLYTFILPEYGRKGIARMYDNIEVPGRFINCLLQARFERSGIEIVRFLVNSTAGIAGFYDVANPYLHMEPQSNSFGQTFAYWGMPPGCYLVLPIQGGTTLRDGIGLIGDWLDDPITWIPPWNFIGINYVSAGLKAGLAFNQLSLVMDDYVKMYDASADPYATFKTVTIALTKLKQQDQLSNGYDPSTSGDTDK